MSSRMSDRSSKEEILGSNTRAVSKITMLFEPVVQFTRSKWFTAYGSYSFTEMGLKVQTFSSRG